MENMDPKRRLKQATAGILCLGLFAAVVIYLTAAEPAENPLIDQIENSKAYRRSLELYGGKANVLAEQFGRWFDSLWHGRSLAFTIAVMTAVVAAVYYFLASPLPPEKK